jgi:DNA-directed RNA polymerase specialized sigma24 family protein
MFGRRKVNREPTPYATRSEFCRIFERDMNSLYLLSFLLTGDRAIAEQCYVGGLHIAQEENQVFKEWVESWARRAIIQNAIRMIRPRLVADRAPSVPTSNLDHSITERAEIAGIVHLPVFERFAFVMSVLERYSDQECSLLLGCKRSDVVAARTRALEHIARFAELNGKPVSIAADQNRRTDGFLSAPRLTAVPSLAPSA